MAKLLIIDDDHDLFNLLSEYLASEGFDCTHAPDAENGFGQLSKASWDIVILDVMLPGKNGLEILREMRDGESSRTIPVLMLTARGDEEDKVMGLELGADDYLAKPFGPKELVARLRALLRRVANNESVNESKYEIFHLDGITIHRNALYMEIGEERIQISPSELRLIEAFADKPGEIIGRDSLCQKIFGRPPFSKDRSLDMLISRLRKKMGVKSDGGERVRAARGEGYIFLLSESAT